MNDLLKTYCSRVDKALKNAIFSAKNTPVILRDAMHYATSNGGKRLRPLLVYATGQSIISQPKLHLHLSPLPNNMRISL